MADDAVDFLVDEILSHRRASFRVSLVIFGDQNELHFVATDAEATAVQFVNRHHGTIFIIFTQVRLGTCQRRGVSNLDGHLCASGGGSVFVATGRKSERADGQGGERQGVTGK